MADEETIIPHQTYNFDSITYFRGRPMPLSVAREHNIRAYREQQGEAVEEPDTAEPLPVTDPTEEQTTPPEEPTPEPPPSDETPLPEDFPNRDLFADAGYDTVEAIDEATIDELTGINGVGPARAKKAKERAKELRSQ